MQRVEADRATDEQLAEIAEVMDEVERESLPDDPPFPAEELIADIRSQPSYSKQVYWTHHEDGRLIGYSWLHLEFKDENKHLGRLGVTVRKQSRRQGIGSRLLLPAAQEARQNDRTLLDSWVNKELDGEGFASAIGAKPAIETFHNRLMMSDLDAEMLNSWVQKAKERADGYELHFYQGATPPEDIEQVAALMKVMNTAPDADYVEDEEFRPDQVAEFEQKAIASGWVPWTLIAKAPSGDLAGYTRIYPNPFRPQILYQEDTGVMPDHRNKGLGRWLKAAMLLRVLDELPEVAFVETGNATSNEAMLGINNALGFKPVETWVKMSIPADDLIARLQARMG